MEYLFEKKRFDEYRNNDEIKKYLEKEKLELLDKNELKQRLEGDYNKKIIDFFHSELCKKYIGYGYVKEVFEKAYVEQRKEFEIIFLIDTVNYNFQGFLISQLGECGIYSDAYVLNLICSKKSAPLLGAYLYMIKKFEGIPKIGILELAGSHTNVKALCAYNKFGFYPDTYLSACFIKNMTMSVNLDLYSGDDIINTVVKGINIDKNNTKSIDLCNKFAIKDSMNLKDYKKNLLLKIQNEIAVLYDNIYDYNSDINEYRLKIDKLKKKFDKIIKINNKNIVKDSNNIVQDNIVQDNSLQDNIVQDNIVQDNSVQDNIVQDSKKYSKKGTKDIVQFSKKGSKDIVQVSKKGTKDNVQVSKKDSRNYTRKKTQKL